MNFPVPPAHAVERPQSGTPRGLLVTLGIRPAVLSAGGTPSLSGPSTSDCLLPTERQGRSRFSGCTGGATVDGVSGYRPGVSTRMIGGWAFAGSLACPPVMRRIA